MTTTSLLPDAMATAWEKAEPSSRFQWKMNARLVAIVLVSPVLLWTYFAYTAYRVGFTGSLLAFAGVYLLYTGWLVVVLMRWRAFCVRSAVVVTSGRLLWTHSGRVFEAKWADIDPRKLGLQELSTSRKLEFALEIKTIEGSKQPLWLYRIYGFMDNLELFVQQLLERSSRGQVMVGKRQMPTTPGARLKKGRR